MAIHIFSFACFLVAIIIANCHYRMVLGFTATCAISAYHHQSCGFESCSWRHVLDTTLCDKFVNVLRQDGGFLQVLRFPPPIKLTATM